MFPKGTFFLVHFRPLFIPGARFRDLTLLHSRHGKIGLCSLLFSVNPSLAYVCTSPVVGSSSLENTPNGPGPGSNYAREASTSASFFMYLLEQCEASNLSNVEKVYYKMSVI